MLSCSLSTLYTHYIAYIYTYNFVVVSCRSFRQIDGSAKLAHQITKHTMHDIIAERMLHSILLRGEMSASNVWLITA